MAALSNYIENKVIDWLLRGQTFTPPANVYVALMTVAAGPSGGGTEVSGNAYARVQVASSLANWAGTQADASTVASTGSSGKTSNNSTLTFPTPTGSWGTVVGVAIYDASTAGNLLFYGALTTSQTVAANNTLSFSPAQMTLTLS